jgi:predicted ester cyclase
MRTDIIKKYEDYIACLNARDLDRLDTFVAGKVVYNGSTIGLAGYRKMLADNYRDIPDLLFDVELLVADDSTVASRLKFDCRPAGELHGIPVNGRRVVFYENVFYRFSDSLITDVWSVIDYKTIEKQI